MHAGQTLTVIIVLNYPVECTYNMLFDSQSATMCSMHMQDIGSHCNVLCAIDIKHMHTRTVNLICYNHATILYWTLTVNIISIQCLYRTLTVNIVPHSGWSYIDSQ